MTTEQLAQIEDRALWQEGTTDLREFLNARGWRMSLLDLTKERARRNITPGIRSRSKTMPTQIGRD
jgi:hypothetical protein